MSGLMFPKPRPAALAKADRRTARQSQDKKESATVKQRSGGQCEVFEVWPGGGRLMPVRCAVRCRRRGNQTHHLIGGFGKRARGISILAERKLYVCQQCHDDIGGDIGGKRLRRMGGVVPHYTDVYERVR